MNEFQLDYIERNRSLIDDPNFDLEKFTDKVWEDWAGSYRDYLNIILPLAFLLKSNLKLTIDDEGILGFYILGWKDNFLLTLDPHDAGSRTPQSFIKSLGLPELVENWVLSKLPKVNNV